MSVQQAQPVQVEALILLHGFSTNTTFATCTLAQLLTLGDFPPHILPFVFGWPAGKVVTYTLARDVGAESERTCEDFKQFLRDIADAGIVKVIIAYASLHSALVLTHQFVQHITSCANATYDAATVTTVAQQA
eukprot:15262-Heterococcus_DN1.PRE.1